MSCLTMFSSLFPAMPRLSLLAQADQTLWMPVQASDVAADVDWVFYMIYWISVFFFVLIVGLGTFFIIRYRGSRDGEATGTMHHNTPLEVTWTVIPLLIVIAIFWWGFEVYINQQTPPDNALQVDVIAQKWSWAFRYSNGAQDSELHVPIDRDVVLTMRSEDVIHSFYVPEFRVKQDVVPGRYTKIWFRPIKEGRFKILCAEYCGTSHSDMVSDVVVQDLGSFQKYLQDLNTLEGPLHERGEQLVSRLGCKSCHNIDTSEDNTGPPLGNLWMKEHQMSDGSMVVADQNYIRESILNPGAKIVAGYEGVMPSFQGRISDEEIDYIIEYIKFLTLGEEYTVVDIAGDVTDATGAAGEAGAVEDATGAAQATGTAEPSDTMEDMETAAEEELPEEAEAN